METGQRGSGFVSPRNITGKTYQELQQAHARKQKLADDHAAGRTYEAGHKAGYIEGRSDGWEKGWQAAVEYFTEIGLLTDETVTAE
jgi:flagellar biosynthesis/type III secretory pathway protein FliH